MTTATLTAIETGEREFGRDREPGRLALILQEPLTTAVRVRANRLDAPDATTFRKHVQSLIAAAHREAAAAGYERRSVKLAMHALVAFIDEAVLNSPLPVFAGWSRRPLQEEVFGEHRAGETYFQHLKELLDAQDSRERADVLEVYLLCLELGFRGRYGSSAGDLHHLKEAARQKIARIRGGAWGLSSPAAPPADETLPPQTDPWLRRMIAIAAGCLFLALFLFAIYTFSLRSDVAELRAVPEQVLP